MFQKHRSFFINNFLLFFKVGKKTNPNGIRLIGLVEKAFLSATYYNNWFSDVQYSSLFYKDLLLRKKK